MIGRKIGRYLVESRLGEGGMGTVWGAVDPTLDRPVAVKLIRHDEVDDELRERFRREARAAAAVNHPNVCQVYEIGEEEGVLFIAMERLDGETLSARLSRGPLSPDEAVRVALGILDALAALHDRRLVHRDLKPSNVFLLPDGRPKLLDFGLVRPLGGTDDEATARLLTAAGALLGTPAYMSPEQVRGDSVDGRSDLFALGAILHEMVAGVSPFPGRTVGEVLAAVLTADPAPVPGETTAARVARVARRALAKRPEDRPASAAALAAELRESLVAPPERGPGERIEAGARPTREIAAAAGRRLVVLPFRFLRPDPDLDFLGFALADAVAGSLSTLDGVRVRSTVAALPLAGEAPDLAVVAARLDVDVVLLGTILSAAGKCRVSAQLVEAPSGQVLSTTQCDAPVDDVFGLQDALSRRIVDALQLPLGGRSRSGPLAGDRPATAEAYELFLRGNAAAGAARDMSVARGLYRRCVEADPNFAPAWARLGRILRFEAKYHPERGEETRRGAEEALARALVLNPELAAAQLVQAYIDVDAGRAEAAIERLLGHVGRRPADAEAWSGLVVALRAVGLLEESLAAHRRAVALDAEIATSVFHTLVAQLRWDDALAALRPGNPFRQVEAGFCLVQAGRFDEARARVREFLETGLEGHTARWAELVLATCDRDEARARRVAGGLLDFPDPEGQLELAGFVAWCGVRDVALTLAESSADGGYANAPFLERWRMLDPLRGEPRFEAVRERMRERHRAAVARFGGCV